MNILSGIIVLILSVVLSILLSNKYAKRKNFYAEFSRFNEKILKEISFTSSSLLKISKTLPHDSDFGLTTSKYFSGEKKVQYLSYLSKEENEYYLYFLSNVGLSDRDSQIAFISKTQQELDEKLKKTNEDEKKYKSLYIKLGFLFGLIMMIILL